MQVLQKKEESIRQAFVQKVKEKESELTVAEQEVIPLISCIFVSLYELDHLPLTEITVYCIAVMEYNMS